MPYLKKPYDRETAHDLMKKFSGLAYSLVNQSVFQEAVNILYGPEFQVTVDLSKRMQFSCQICNREMNSEKAMREHTNSGAHQKNLDKKVRDSGRSNYNARSRNYAKDSIHFRLLNSSITPVGLQMIEEYINSKGNIYYKCTMCGAHGKLEMIYQHIIGKKHTERYIKSCCVLENSILNPNERETLRQELIKDEGINVDAIKAIKGDQYYPYKWEKEGISSTMFNRTIKREPPEGGTRLKSLIERRASSSSPTPGPSRGRSRSISPSRSYCSKSPSRSREYGSRSPSTILYGHSPSRRSQSRSPSLQRDGLTLSRQEDLSAYRNRSPSPPVRIKRESLSPPPRIKKESVSPPPRVKEEPKSPVASPDFKNSIQMPVAIPAIKKEKSDATIQTNLNLDIERMHLEDYTSTSAEKPIRTPEEAKLAIETMNCYANTIRGVVIRALEDGTPKSSNKMKMLEYQKAKIEKVIGYATKWYLPTWKNELQNL